MKYADFHVHVNLGDRDDGQLPPEEVLALAQTAGIGVTALTPHNNMVDLTELRKAFPEIQIVQGTEISCLFGETEIHVLGLGIDANSPAIQEVFRHNNPDRRLYVEEILYALKKVGIHISYEKIQETYPDRTYFGRMQIASVGVALGYTSSVPEFMDRYIGNCGQRLAFVPNPFKWVGLETAVNAILASGGIASLAHLNYYQLSEYKNHRLVHAFKELAGDRGAIESIYGPYSPSTRDFLRDEFAGPYKLLESCGSDFHGVSMGDRLDYGFKKTRVQPLLEALGIKER